MKIPMREKLLVMYSDHIIRIGTVLIVMFLLFSMSGCADTVSLNQSVGG